MRLPSMKQLFNNHSVFIRYLQLVLLLLSCVVFHENGYTRTLSAELLQNKGNALTIRIQVPSPPPASLIVEFSIPSGIKILKSSPGISKFDTKSKSAKWLLRNIAAGTTNISIVTSERINTRNAAAVIRYRNRESGSFVEVRAVSSQ